MQKFHFLSFVIAGLAMVSSCKKQESVAPAPANNAATVSLDPTLMSRDGHTALYYKDGKSTTLDELLRMETDSSILFSYLDEDSNLSVYFQSGITEFESFAAGRPEAESILPYIRIQRTLRSWIVDHDEEEYFERYGEPSEAFIEFQNQIVGGGKTTVAGTLWDLTCRENCGSDSYFWYNAYPTFTNFRNRASLVSGLNMGWLFSKLFYLGPSRFFAVYSIWGSMQLAPVGFDNRAESGLAL